LDLKARTNSLLFHRFWHNPEEKNHGTSETSHQEGGRCITRVEAERGAVEHHTSLQQVKNSIQLKAELNAAYACAEKLTAKECNALRKESQNLIKNSTLDRAKIRDLRGQITQKDGEIARLNRQLSYQVAVQSSSDLRIKGLEKQNAGLKGLSTQNGTKVFTLPENATQPQQLEELFADSNSVTEGVSGPPMPKTGPCEPEGKGGRDHLQLLTTVGGKEQEILDTILGPS
jgi:hypothetical protein